MRAITSTVYKFDELSEAAKEKAREWYREGDLGYEWWDTFYDDFARIADILGIDLRQRPVKLMNGKTRYDPCIWWSGFASQGDGAMWEGDYRYAKGSCKKIREYAPNDNDLHEIADGLYQIQKRYFYRVTAMSKHRGYYYHEYCMDIDVFCTNENGYEIDNFVHDEEVKDLLRDFARWIYRQLESEYDYLMSDEAVDECIRANEYEFDEDGCSV